MRLYLLCVRWGLAAGAAVGAVTLGADGAGLGPGSESGFALGEVLWGAGAGLVVAIVPAALGSLFVTTLEWRPADSWSPDSVRRDLNAVIAITVAILDGCTLALMLYLDGPLLELLPLLLLANVACLLVLWRARASIGRSLSAAWVRESAGV